jgi:hypothetical protein
MSKTRNKITIPIHDIKDLRWFTHQIENGNQWKSLYSPCLLKIPQKIAKSVFYGSVIKTSPICGIQHQSL